MTGKGGGRREGEKRWHIQRVSYLVATKKLIIFFNEYLMP